VFSRECGYASRGTICGVAAYSLNDRAVEKAKRLIESRQYVLNSDWGDVQPNAAAENAYLESHSWDEYGEWHLGLTEGATEGSKARYAFVYGDFRRLHRTGIIACHYRAAEWRHKEIELAAHELLQLLDKGDRVRADLRRPRAADKGFGNCPTHLFVGL
jgi:hypothetical protein